MSAQTEHKQASRLGRPVQGDTRFSNRQMWQSTILSTLLTVLRVTLVPVEAAPEEPAGHQSKLRPDLCNVLPATWLTVVDGGDTEPRCALHQ